MTRRPASTTMRCLVPIVRCPRCALRQYAPASYTRRSECVECQTPLRTSTTGERSRSQPFDGQIERAAADERPAS
jgi:hypothetical protein